MQKILGYKILGLFVAAGFAAILAAATPSSAQDGMPPLPELPKEPTASSSGVIPPLPSAPIIEDKKEEKIVPKQKVVARRPTAPVPVIGGTEAIPALPGTEMQEAAPALPDFGNIDSGATPPLQAPGETIITIPATSTTAPALPALPDFSAPAQISAAPENILPSPIPTTPGVSVMPDLSTMPQPIQISPAVPAMPDFAATQPTPPPQNPANNPVPNLPDFAMQPPIAPEPQNPIPTPDSSKVEVVAPADIKQGDKEGDISDELKALLEGAEDDAAEEDAKNKSKSNALVENLGISPTLDGKGKKPVRPNSDVNYKNQVLPSYIYESRDPKNSHLRAPVKSSSLDRHLLSASANGDFNAVLAITSSGRSPNIKTENGDTPLILATHAGHTKIVKLLLSKGADASLENNQGQRALDYANAAGNTEISAILEPRTKAKKVAAVDKKSKAKSKSETAKGEKQIPVIATANPAGQAALVNRPYGSVDAKGVWTPPSQDDGKWIQNRFGFWFKRGGTRPYYDSANWVKNQEGEWWRKNDIELTKRALELEQAVSSHNTAIKDVIEGRTPKTPPVRAIGAPEFKIAEAPKSYAAPELKVSASPKISKDISELPASMRPGAQEKKMFVRTPKQNQAVAVPLVQAPIEKAPAVIKPEVIKQSAQAPVVSAPVARMASPAEASWQKVMRGIHYEQLNADEKKYWDRLFIDWTEADRNFDALSLDQKKYWLENLKRLRIVFPSHFRASGAKEQELLDAYMARWINLELSYPSAPTAPMQQVPAELPAGNQQQPQVSQKLPAMPFGKGISAKTPHSAAAQTSLSYSSEDRVALVNEWLALDEQSENMNKSEIRETNKRRKEILKAVSPKNRIGEYYEDVNSLPYNIVSEFTKSMRRWDAKYSKPVAPTVKFIKPKEDVSTHPVVPVENISPAPVVPAQPAPAPSAPMAPPAAISAPSIPAPAAPELAPLTPPSKPAEPAIPTDKNTGLPDFGSEVSTPETKPATPAAPTASVKEGLPEGAHKIIIKLPEGQNLGSKQEQPASSPPSSVEQKTEAQSPAAAPVPAPTPNNKLDGLPPLPDFNKN